MRACVRRWRTLLLRSAPAALLLLLLLLRRVAALLLLGSAPSALRRLLLRLRLSRGTARASGAANGRTAVALLRHVSLGRSCCVAGSRLRLRGALVSNVRWAATAQGEGGVPAGPPPRGV
jgi:hypothetical protein